MKISKILAAGALISAGGAMSAETVTYTYDAKGRLVRVVHAGTVNSGVVVQYSHDRVDNRTRVIVTR